jgi:hypothetical protein
MHNGNQYKPLLQFEFDRKAQDGIAATGPYRWARWRFWNVGMPYINFIGLHPRNGVERMDGRIDTWLTRWERGADRAAWSCGGYVVTNLFGMIAHRTSDLRAMAADQDIVGPRNHDAVMVFARNPATRMIVMLPGIDAAADLRETYQALILSALLGLGKPIATIGPDEMPREWKP